MTSPEPEVTGNDVTGSDPKTGSDVFLNGKPLTSMKNRSWAQGRQKPRRKRGLKVQSPSAAAGVTHIWPIYGFDMVLIWHKSNSSKGICMLEKKIF